jgi:ribosome-associated protein
LELAHTIVDALEAKKGEDILLLDLQKVESFTDYFVLCTGTSARMLEALAEGVLEDVRKRLSRKGSREGPAEAGWIVLDFGAVVVHLFAPEQRGFYRLEDLWSQGKVVLRLQ